MLPQVRSSESIFSSSDALVASAMTRVIAEGEKTVGRGQKQQLRSSVEVLIEGGPHDVLVDVGKVLQAASPSPAREGNRAR